MLHVVVTLSRHEASEVKWSSFDIVSPQGQDIIFFGGEIWIGIEFGKRGPLFRVILGLRTRS